MADTPKIDVSLADVLQLGHGSHFFGSAASEPPPVSAGNAMTNNVYGINHRQTPLAIPLNKDKYGYTFFTRPQLNMQTDNLQNIRKMYPLLTQTALSYHRMVRCLLDPRQMTGYGDGTPDNTVNAITCPLVDNQNAFIPVLTNSLESISGWPDILVPTFSAREGPYKEGYTMVDGTTVDYTTYNVSASFRNSRGDPISILFETWENYMGYVFEGTLSPYFDYIVDNMFDYNTRIYRLVMDPSNRLVQRMCSCGAAFPLSMPVGAMYDFDASKPYNDANAQISLQFRCMGFINQDDINIRTFNATVATFNPDMRSEKLQKFGMSLPKASMMPIPHYLTPLFNNRGYPRIDPDTRELQWWIRKDYFERRMEGYKNIDQALDNALGLNLSYQPTATA